MWIAGVVPACNRLGYLPATLESVLAQARLGDEVVVDDASSEDVAAVAAHCAEVGVRRSALGRR